MNGPAIKRYNTNEIISTIVIDSDDDDDFPKRKSDIPEGPKNKKLKKNPVARPSNIFNVTGSNARNDQRPTGPRISSIVTGNNARNDKCPSTRPSINPLATVNTAKNDKYPPTRPGTADIVTGNSTRNEQNPHTISSIPPLAVLNNARNNRYLPTRLTVADIVNGYIPKNNQHTPTKSSIPPLVFRNNARNIISDATTGNIERNDQHLFTKSSIPPLVIINDARNDQYPPTRPNIDPLITANNEKNNKHPLTRPSTDPLITGHNARNNQYTPTRPSIDPLITGHNARNNQYSPTKPSIDPLMIGNNEINNIHPPTISSIDPLITGHDARNAQCPPTRPNFTAIITKTISRNDLKNQPPPTRPSNTSVVNRSMAKDEKPLPTIPSNDPTLNENILRDEKFVHISNLSQYEKIFDKKRYYFVSVDTFTDPLYQIGPDINTSSIQSHDPLASNDIQGFEQSVKYQSIEYRKINQTLIQPNNTLVKNDNNMLRGFSESEQNKTAECRKKYSAIVHRYHNVIHSNYFDLLMLQQKIKIAKRKKKQSLENSKNSQYDSDLLIMKKVEFLKSGLEKRGRGRPKSKKNVRTSFTHIKRGKKPSDNPDSYEDDSNFTVLYNNVPYKINPSYVDMNINNAMLNKPNLTKESGDKKIKSAKVITDFEEFKRKITATRPFLILNEESKVNVETAEDFNIIFPLSKNTETVDINFRNRAIRKLALRGQVMFVLSRILCSYLLQV